MDFFAVPCEKRVYYVFLFPKSVERCIQCVCTVLYFIGFKKSTVNEYKSIYSFALTFAACTILSSSQYVVRPRTRVYNIRGFDGEERENINGLNAVGVFRVPAARVEHHIKRGKNEKNHKPVYWCTLSIV